MSELNPQEEPFYSEVRTVLPVNAACPHCGRVAGCIIRVLTYYPKSHHVSNFTCPNPECKKLFTVTTDLEIKIQVGETADLSISRIEEDHPPG